MLYAYLVFCEGTGHQTFSSFYNFMGIFPCKCAFYVTIICQNWNIIANGQCLYSKIMPMRLTTNSLCDAPLNAVRKIVIVVLHTWMLGSVEILMLQWLNLTFN